MVFINGLFSNTSSISNFASQQKSSAEPAPKHKAKAKLVNQVWPENLNLIVSPQHGLLR